MNEGRLRHSFHSPLLVPSESYSPTDSFFRAPHEWNHTTVFLQTTAEDQIEANENSI